MKVAVDPERCRGHGVCVSICPDVFVLNDDGYSEARTPEVPAGLEEAARQAIVDCPEQAIGES